MYKKETNENSINKQTTWEKGQNRKENKRARKSYIFTVNNFAQSNKKQQRKKKIDPTRKIKKKSRG